LLEKPGWSIGPTLERYKPTSERAACAAIEPASLLWLSTTERRPLLSASIARR
jgi:hypothetical protein